MKDQDHDYDRTPGIAQALRLVLKPYCYMYLSGLALTFFLANVLHVCTECIEGKAHKKL